MFEILGKKKDELTLVIEGREVIVTSASLIQTMDTGADGFSAVIPWNPGEDPELDRITAPYSYSRCRIFFGGELLSEMKLYNVKHSTTNSGTTKTLEMYSKTADIIDSTVIAPYTAMNIKLTDRCKQQCAPFGINVYVGDDAAKSINEVRRVTTQEKFNFDFDPGNAGFCLTNKLVPLTIKMGGVVNKSKIVKDEKLFAFIKSEPTEKIFEHLLKLAAQRGCLLSCTKNGDLLITKANINSSPVGTIQEASSMQAEQYEAAYKGRDRYNIYRAIVKSAGSKATQYMQAVVDPVVTSPRIITFSADRDIPGDAKNAALWRKNKTAADTMTVSFPVNSWLAPNADYWKPNTLLTVISTTIGAKNGFTFLISQVEFKYENHGSTAILGLKPPSVYSTGEIKEPWVTQ